jgi:hypothetical protein
MGTFQVSKDAWNVPVPRAAIRQRWPHDPVPDDATVYRWLSARPGACSRASPDAGEAKATAPVRPPVSIRLLAPSTAPKAHTVTVHELWVTSVGEGIEPRRHFPGISVEMTNGVFPATPRRRARGQL